MPYIISTTCWPSDKTPEVVKKAIEVVKKFPEDKSLGEQVVPNAVTPTTDGIKTISIFEVKKGKLEEALTRSQKISAMYQTIAGFEYAIEVWLTLIEAYAAIGQTPPE